ncbi:hypothetical protein [Erythrobacter sp. WG]|uniref:hypothetical protein n=1 Tax=Erythrobacter sp. WG TaxID=2985510 RepID=UPI00226FF303|nr:hypothetical protein [Erythrobacter sp. WG]MCX9148683.1 hypothetical protein [Erythrobacter sp. WG]
MSLIALALALTAATAPAGAAAAPVAGSPAMLTPSESAPRDAGRAGRGAGAIVRASLADGNDPAVLINRGIAYAQAGDEARAREAFTRVLAHEEVVDLETADGATTDSRKLARRAMRMLERGEFRVSAAPAGQLTYRD